ncbi:hypothetical protein E3P99_03070 [Wallemia hederae]|uniref:Uncharacterized protein n=1 Tax=Wallemia hederae TaxID=1540922 RepID=A0A4T0FHC3_9BASI|nr:hypothetical protein E3P99_03070 [Wallemia hederae]
MPFSAYIMSSESISIPQRQRSSSESSVGSASASHSHKPSSVKAALPSTSPFSAQPFKDSGSLGVAATATTPPQALSIQPPRRLSGSFEMSGQPSPSPTSAGAGAAGSGITGLFRRFSFKGNNQPQQSMDASRNLNTITAKQPLQTEQAGRGVDGVDNLSVRDVQSPPQKPSRRKSEQKRSVSPMGERILRGSFDGSGY